MRPRGHRLQDPDAALPVEGDDGEAGGGGGWGDADNASDEFEVDDGDRRGPRPPAACRGILRV